MKSNPILLKDQVSDSPINVKIDPEKARAMIASLNKKNQQLKDENDKLLKTASRPKLSFSIDGPNLNLVQSMSSNGKRFQSVRSILKGEGYSSLVLVLRPFIELVNSALRQRDLERATPRLKYDKIAKKMLPLSNGEGPAGIRPSPISKVRSDMEAMMNVPDIKLAFSFMEKELQALYPPREKKKKEEKEATPVEVAPPNFDPILAYRDKDKTDDGPDI